jgi:hypothetical protein
MSVPSDPSTSEQPPPASWWVDISVALVLVVGLALLRPLWPDGDAQGHANRAINRSLLGAMETKHILYAPLLRCILLGLEGTGLRPYAIEAFTLLSNLCGGILYLLLARGLFLPLLRDVTVARLCALGTVLSFGVLLTCATIETYAMALTVDVALATFCLRTGLETVGQAAGAAVLFVLAVGIHVTNVLMLPFVLAILLTSGRRHGWAAPATFCGVVFLGAVVLASGLVFGVPTEDGKPNWTRLFPHSDPHPTMSLGGRLGRAAYGFVRTFAWLVPYLELTWTFAVVYISAFVLSGLLIAFIASRGFLANLGKYGWATFLILLIVVPFSAMGVYYYGSDSERWLFLMPVVWFILGVIWTDYRPAPDAWLSPGMARGLLAVLVLVMGSYNVLFKIWPEARSSKDYEGLVDLQQRAGSNDLIVAASGIRGITEEFILRQRLHGEVLGLDELMLVKHKSDVAAGQADLRAQVRKALTEGRRVLVFGLLEEGLSEGRGYPWAWVQPLGYTPEKMLSVLEEFHPRAIVKPDDDHVGLFELSAAKAAP